MENIYNSDEQFINFDFDKLILTKPTQTSGGNYFMRFLINNNPLYVQPPKCSTKQGIIKAGKRIYTDMMFTNENENFLNWMEKLENYCQNYIYNNRNNWFDSEIELHDIENYFTSPFKIYKSGKYYIIRVNISNILGKPILKIYDENETEISLESINEKMNIMTILEIQGIKCSSRSFQIEIELKQMMVLKQFDIFEKCLFTPSKISSNSNNDTEIYSGLNKVESISNEIEINIANQGKDNFDFIEKNVANMDSDNEIDAHNNGSNIIIKNEKLLNNASSSENLGDFVIQDENLEDNQYEKNNLDNYEKVAQNENTIQINDKDNKNENIEEIDFNLEQLPENDIVKLKQRNDVYYDLYREAKKKAKIARDFAISAYLEAKEIKNKYMLDEIDDSDDDDDDDDDDDYENNENEFNFDNKF
jgi:hypothetical protein